MTENYLYRKLKRMSDWRKIIIERLGEIRKNTYGTEMQIIRYNKCSDITVKFLDEYGFEVNTTYNNFKMGWIKNPYDKTVYGVGYIGVGKYKSAIRKQELEPRYSVWRNLIGRCYSDKVRNHNIYADCEVCKEWHNYQSFAVWYDANIYQVGTERMHLDKDILFENNRLYSPDTCLIVPQSINELFHINSRKRKDKDLPYTITRTNIGKYSVSYKGNLLGVCNNVDQCIELYISAKRRHLRERVKKLESELPEKVKIALFNW